MIVHIVKCTYLKSLSLVKKKIWYSVKSKFLNKYTYQVEKTHSSYESHKEINDLLSAVNILDVNLYFNYMIQIHERVHESYLQQRCSIIIIKNV